MYESWPVATGPQPVAKPIAKKTGSAMDDNDKEVEEDEGEATPEGNKRLLADILSVSHEDSPRRRR